MQGTYTQDACFPGKQHTNFAAKNKLHAETF